MFKNKDYKEIDKFISKFNVHSFNNKKFVDEYKSFFSLQDFCENIPEDNFEYKNNELERTVVENEQKPFEPEFNDLCRLHYLLLNRRVLTALEFGSGFSTVIMAHAMELLDSEYRNWASENTRIDNPFSVHSIEVNKKFIEITESRIKMKGLKKSNIHASKVEVGLHDNRVVTFYSNLPNISPDLIYIDGPTVYDSNETINGFALNHKFRMPMSADVLKFEFYLEPGTLILVDGRTANSRFLRSYLRRNWNYFHDMEGDVHYFELNEEPLGKLNQVKIDFCLKNKWLLD